MKIKLLQRACIWFSFAKGDSYGRCLQDLTRVFGGSRMSEHSVRRWWKDFSDGTRDKNNISDRKSTGRPRTARTDENTTVILEHVLADRRVSVAQLSQESGLSVGSVHKILRKDLGMSRVCAKFVPRLLSDEEKTHRMATCQEWLDNLEQEPDILQRVITADESWVWLYDPETKMESTQWVRRNVDSRPKKALRARSTKKLMILPFFDIHSIIHVEYIQGTIKSEDYIECLMRLRDQIRVKRPALWTAHNWILLDDNAPVHTSDETMTFHRQVKCTRGPHPPYSPDLVPCDFFLFPKLKRKLRGRRFQNLDQLKTEVETILDSFTDEDFKYCFHQLQDRWLRCLESQGNYFEGDCLQ